MPANDQPQSRKGEVLHTASEELIASWEDHNFPHEEKIRQMANECDAQERERLALLKAIRSELPSGMAEMVIESAGLTSSGAAAQAGEKSGTAPTASVPAVSERALIGRIVVERGLVRDSIGPITALPEGEYELRRVER